MSENSLTTAKTLQSSFSIVIGGKSSSEILRDIRSERKIFVEESLQRLLNQDALMTQILREKIDLVILSPADLGFQTEPPNHLILNPRLLEKWSKEFLRGQTIELCPPETAVYLVPRISAEHNHLWVASFPLLHGGDIVLFIFEFRRAPSLRLSTINPARRWNLSTRLVFRLVSK